MIRKEQVVCILQVDHIKHCVLRAVMYLIKKPNGQMRMKYKNSRKGPVILVRGPQTSVQSNI